MKKAYSVSVAEWKNRLAKDERIQRSYTHYKEIYCLCYPRKKDSSAYDIKILTSEGDWQSGQYKLVHIFDSLNVEDYKEIPTLKEAQRRCVDIVESYLRGEIKPTYTERERKSNSSIAAGARRRSKKNRRR